MAHGALIISDPRILLDVMRQGQNLSRRKLNKWNRRMLERVQTVISEQRTQSHRLGRCLYFHPDGKSLSRFDLFECRNE